MDATPALRQATDMAYSTKLLRMLRLFKLLKIVRCALQPLHWGD